MNFFFLGLIGFALLIVAYVTRFLYRFYKLNFLQRYFKGYAMLWYPESKRKDWTSEKISYYYADFLPGIHCHAFAANQLIQVDLENGLYMDHPAMIAEWCIIHYEKFLEHQQESDFRIFKQHLDWLLENLIYDDTNAACWYYHFDLSDEKAPFFSGISQGIGMSALLRGYAHFQDPIYLNAAIAAYKWMVRPVEQNGCLYTKGSFAGWLEEDNFYTHILNGHIYSLLGLYDLFRVTKDKEVEQHFKNGCDSALINKQHFDIGFYSKYAATVKMPTNNSYHLIHIIELRILAEITKNKAFEIWAQEYQDYYDGLYHRTRMFVFLLRHAITSKFSKS
jgi:hypothetical protein